MKKKRYYTFNRFMREKTGDKVRKISVDGGFTCPNRDGKAGLGGCIYCHTPSFVPMSSNSQKTVSAQVGEGISRLKARGFKGKFIVYFQAYTNTYAQVKTLKQLYDEALDCEEVIGLSIGTRPDCVSNEVLLLLEGYAKNYHVWIEYGLQSSNDKTLIRINRGHNYAQFEDAVKRTQKRGMYICAHIILGLPGEDREQMHETIKRISDLGVDGVKIHHLQVVRGAVLERKYNDKEVKVLSIADYVPLVCDIIERLSPEMIVHRLIGDVYDELLVAPRWELSKTEILSLIDKEMERRGTYQGARYIP
ncbi:MAG: TIGR01212 family radical SAM protein [Thermodesulfobacteriota bacterium]|nr:TIGR01212 family radical SAM protein [Thermodesulfobacteriota bacterium]